MRFFRIGPRKAVTVMGTPTGELQMCLDIQVE